MQHVAVVCACVVALASACTRADRATDDGGGTVADAGATDLGAAPSDGADASPDLLPVAADTLAANRDRLLATYLAWLVAHPGAQTNGLDGATLSTVCELWSRLDPSSRATWLTLTARLQGGRLADGSSMLRHVTVAYRVSGGQGATATSPGSCGGGEYNRLMLSVDATLHAALVAAHQHQGAAQAGAPDLADSVGGDSWRDSHDAAGPHAPFDLSDETDSGAPRGQVQFFADTTSARAQAPLGRVDLMTLVDPWALEIDQDYDCVHASNPLCTYVTYGPLCAPEAASVGEELYEARYGSIDAVWQPNGC